MRSIIKNIHRDNGEIINKIFHKLDQYIKITNYSIKQNDADHNWIKNNNNIMF